MTGYSVSAGIGPVVFQNVACTGNESKLFDCDQSGTCTHSNGVSVICQKRKYIRVFNC